MTRRVVLGLGNSVDYEIQWDSAVLESLVVEHGIVAAELGGAGPIVTERDLVVSILGHLRAGTGGERRVASSGLLETFAARFVTRTTLGGTGVRAAVALLHLGIPSTVHLVSTDAHVRRLLPPGIVQVSSADQDSTEPHLVVQFGSGATVHVGDVAVRAPHPNRLIYADDAANRSMRLSEKLGDVLRDAGVFVISGFNAMDDAVLLEERLRELVRHMALLPPGALVIYEDAGYHHDGLSHQVRAALLDRIDLYSLNEDEMQGYLGRRVELTDPAGVSRALTDLRTVLPARALLVHTKLWCVVLGDRAREFEPGVRGGVAVASARYVHGDRCTSDDVRAVAAARPSPAGVAVVTEVEVAVPGAFGVPALDLDVSAPTTVGLGDSFVGGMVGALLLPDHGWLGARSA